MEVEQVLHMNEGDGDDSYANNSKQQKEVILKAKTLLQESIVKLFLDNSFPECIRFADLGCSSGPTALSPTWEAIEALDRICQRLNRKTPILQVFLNDLPGNDFNTIFKSLPSFNEKLKKAKGHEFGSCFIAAVPGSFYRKLFPPHFLHFVFSSYSLHWLSQVPEGLIGESEIPVNRGNIYPTKTSPSSVHKAYLDQFEKDFTIFLRLRSEELIPGGCMVLSLRGNQTKDESSKSYRPILLELIGTALHEMVSEGLVEESQLDKFNMPLYTPCIDEVRSVIQSEGSYDINWLEAYELSWDAGFDNGDCKSLEGKYQRGKHVAKSIRSVCEPILASHFGNAILDDLFQRFYIKIMDYMGMGLGIHTNILVSLTKK